jgi:hypothetical protein
MIETALVFDLDGKTIHWHEPNDRSMTHIGDTRDLWDVLWENRARLGGVAHTHPWNGRAVPSETDLTTFDVDERGLGKKLLWPVVTFNDVTYIARLGRIGDPNSSWVRIEPDTIPFQIEGLEELRIRSGGRDATPENVTVPETSTGENEND